MAIPPAIANRKGKTLAIITIGIDLAKNVFAVHSVDETGKPMLVKSKVQRANLLALIAQIPAYLIDMEASFGAHHRARLFQQHSHTVQLIAPSSSMPRFNAQSRRQLQPG